MPKIASKNLRQISTMMDEDVAAVVLIEADRDPIENESFKIYSLRTAKIEDNQWYPRAVQVKEPAVFFIGGNMYGSYQSGTVTIENL